MVLSLMDSRVQISVSGGRCFDGVDDVRTGVNFRMSCEFALHCGAATLTGCSLHPCHGAIVLLVGALNSRLGSDFRLGGAVRPCMGADALLTRAIRPCLGSDSRLTGEFALHRGSAALTKGALRPCHGATVLLVDTLNSRLVWILLKKAFFAVLSDYSRR